MASLHDIIRGDVIPLSGLAVSLGRNSFDPPSPTVPFYDIHHRTGVLYDSGLANGSGVIYYNATKNRLELIPSNSGARAIITAVLFEAYATVSNSGIFATETTVAFDTVRVNTHPEIFNYLTSNGQHALQINASGLYQFDFSVTLDNRAITFQGAECWVERQSPGGLFAQIPGASSFSFMRNNGSTADKGSCHASFLLDAVGAGDKFRIRSITDASVAAGSEPIQYPNGCNFLVRKLG